MVDTLLSSFSTQWELDDVTAFIVAQPDLGVAEQSFYKAVESINANIRWREQHEDDLIDWLESARR